MISLNFDAAVLDRATGAAALFQLLGQGFELFLGQGNAGHAGYPFAFAALGLPGYAHDAVGFGGGLGIGTRALRRGLAAVRADLAVFRGIDQTGILFVLHGGATSRDCVMLLESMRLAEFPGNIHGKVGPPGPGHHVRKVAFPAPEAHVCRMGAKLLRHASASDYSGNGHKSRVTFLTREPSMHHGPPFKIGFRSWLMLLSTFASLPMVFFSVMSLFFLVDSQLTAEKSQLTRAAMALSRDLDRLLTAKAAMLVAVAESDAARTDDLAALYGQAARLVSNIPELLSIALVDREGKILFNTLRPYGVPLPATRDPLSARRVIETGRPQVSAAFVGTISHQQVTALGVAVLVAGQARYCLRAIVPVTELKAILAQQHLPEGWSAAVLEENAPIAIHNTLFPQEETSQKSGNGGVAAGPHRSGGRKGAQELIETALAEVGDWGWQAAVSVQESAFAKPLRQMLVKFSVAGGLCLLAGMFAAYWLARRLDREVRAIAAPPNDLSPGQASPGQGTIIREMGEVRACLLAARNREEQAMIDPLTGLLGRGRFWELAGQLEQTSRGDLDLGMAVMFIDLDGFKHINDTFGHDQGDRVLRDVAGILRESVRDTDVVGRLGGDEFAVCLTARRGHLIPASAAIAERIVRKVGELGEGIGCSIGISVCENCPPELSRSLILADKAMYEAKRLGKNRYVIREDTT